MGGDGTGMTAGQRRRKRNPSPRWSRDVRVRGGAGEGGCLLIRRRPCQLLPLLVPSPPRPQQARLRPPGSARAQGPARGGAPGLGRFLLCRLQQSGEGREGGMGSVVLPTLRRKREVDAAIRDTLDKVLVLRFGRASDAACLQLDDVVSTQHIAAAAPRLPLLLSPVATV